MSQQNPNPNQSQSKEKEQSQEQKDQNNPNLPGGNNPGGEQGSPEPPKQDPPKQDPPKPAEKKETHFTGNLDKEKKHKLDISWKNHVVVNQVKITTVEGNVVELENSRQIQTYDVATYERMMAMEPDFFAEAKMRVKVLHDPRIEK